MPLTFLLPIADFKTIQVPRSVEGLSLSGPMGTALVSGLILVLCIFAFYIITILHSSRGTPQHRGKLRGHRPRGPSARPRKPDILIDGSNVMHWTDNTPSLAPLSQVIQTLRNQGYTPGVVFDANAGWKLFDRFMGSQAFALMLGMHPSQVFVVPKGTQADPYLLDRARTMGVRIVTNDRFRDWSDAHPKVREQGFLIGGTLQDGRVLLKGLPSKTVSSA